MATQIDTTQLKKAYEDYSNAINNYNKQLKKNIIKSALKITFVFACCVVAGFAIAAASFSLAGIALPVGTWSMKQIAVLTLSMGGGVAGGLAIGANIWRLTLDKSTLLKMNELFDKGMEGNSEEMNEFLMGYCSSLGTYKIKLDSYIDTEEIYKGIQVAKIKEKEEQSWFPKWFQ